VKSAHGASLSQAQATPGMDIPTRAFRHDLTNSDARMTSPLVQLLRSVAATGYRFTTTTPLTHRRVLGRRGNRVGTTLRDIFGWNLPFVEGSIAPTLLATMDRAGVLIPYFSGPTRIASPVLSSMPCKFPHVPMPAHQRITGTQRCVFLMSAVVAAPAVSSLPGSWYAGVRPP